ncbi:uncharacterized protein LOC115629290 [Scaptodrosophila lebanonensis]|uniref:Uncharacterized protein LOC115629290 n=1 Tax=Drosophila lebanonensis TaxID=7225 RepID=A0A6J2U113_DROLE|nr:uncharacterized protein LOC115629290 [Scaptodrosophila lebanonensis]
MAEGFKKYFNSTTINGRANVAKATYASITLIYLFYRMRRGSGKNPPSDKTQQPACSCDKSKDTNPRLSDEPYSGIEDPDAGIDEPEPDCAVCRERAERAMTEYDEEHQRRSAKGKSKNNGCNGRDEPPTPPPPSSSPPSSGSGTPSRRKCPCEDPHRRVDSTAKMSAQLQRISIPGQEQQQTCHNISVPCTEQPTAVGDLMAQVPEAVYRVLRNVVDAVLGSAAVTTGSGTALGEAPDGAGIIPVHDHTAMSASTTNPQTHGQQFTKQQENETADFEDSGRSSDELLYEQHTRANRSVSPGPQVDHTHNRYRYFTDGFASDMFFENFEE